MRISALVALGAVSSAALAGTTSVTLTREVPDLDRWNYPFNSTPGVRDATTTFAAIGVPFLDNHDAQTLVGFDTDAASDDGAGVIESGLGEARYDVTSATVTLTIAVGGAFAYDSTFDARETYLDPMNPDFTPDPDAGRPIMLFGTGYRAGFGIEPGTIPFTETTPFTFGDPAQPRVRNAYASDYLAGAPRDVSNHVIDGFEIFPFAIGEITDAGAPVAEGALVPVESTVTFNLDVSNADVQDFLRRSLDAGNLQLSVTSLQQASGGPGGGDGVNYPIYFTKEDPLAVLFGQAPQLTLEVTILPAAPADLNGDGVVDATDLATLIASWGQTGVPADFNGDGVGADDLAALLAAWG